MLTAMWVVLVLYLLALVALAAWSHREAVSVSGYYVAGKRLPYWVVAFSTNATGESGWLLLGLTGMAYLVGFHAIWVGVAEVVGVSLTWLLVAGRLKRETDRYGSITVPDYLESRFDDTRHVLRLIGTGIILIMVGAYTAAQMIAAGKTFGTFLQISYPMGVVLGAGITLLYTSYGGFKAVAYTDVLQGVLMLAALILLPAAGLWAAGGLGATLDGLRAVDPGLLRLLGEHGWTLAGLVSVASFLAIGLPFLGVPQLLVRFISIRSEREIRSAAAVSIGCIVLFDIGAILTGLAGRVLFPDLADPETIFPTMSRALFSPVVSGVFMVMVLAAVMSTVDSLLILASSAVVRDVFQMTLRPDYTERQLTLLGQFVTVVVGIGAMLFALTEAKVIFWFVLFAWSGLGAAFGPPVLCALLWRGTTRMGAIVGMLGGFLATVLWAALLKERFYDLYEAIPGFLLGLVLTVGVSLLTRERTSAEAA